MWASGRILPGLNLERMVLPQEFDGAGYRWQGAVDHVECKAGPVRQEAIQKLENNLKLYGGVAARGLLDLILPLE